MDFGARQSRHINTIVHGLFMSEWIFAHTKNTAEPIVVYRCA
jgi:hypothetical protein